MLSILIPTYNYDTVALVKTLQQQTIESTIIFEIIVLDDASTDQDSITENKKINTLEHCQFIENKENLGRTATRNKLALKAKFKWLLYLDADVIPLAMDFIKQYSEQLNKKYTVISGGIVYDKEKPKKEQLLRWVYGNKRESKSIAVRNKNPHNLISANLLIDKELFLKANNFETNKYGLDIYFSYKIRMLKPEILHIDNPTIHLGLESSSTFIKKSLGAIETTFNLENEQKIDATSRPLQKNTIN